MNEHRISPRRRVLKTGQIAFSDKVPKLECTVRNLSETGALLEISTTVGMPASFGLFIDGVRHPLRKTREQSRRIGPSAPSGLSSTGWHCFDLPLQRPFRGR
jgi:hypothetical protein